MPPCGHAGRRLPPLDILAGVTSPQRAPGGFPVVGIIGGGQLARMCAAPGTPDYGRLSVMLQARFRVTRLFTVPPGAFHPPPQVESAVARLVPLGADKPAIADLALFARIVAAAFGQRRKTLRNALSTMADHTAIRAVGIDPSMRGETLSVAAFVRLANALAGKR